MKDLIKNVLVPVIGVVTALLAGWVNYSVSTVKNALEVQKGQLEEQQASLDRLTAERNLRKFDEDLTFRIYEAVTASLNANNLKQQQAATALVIVMATEPLRTQLLQVFDQSQTTTPEVKERVAKVLKSEQDFQQEEAEVVPSLTVKPPPQAAGSGWGDWDIDVFWCERSGESARLQSQKLVAALQKDGARGRLRSRILPDSINAQPGYRVRNFVIRRDPSEGERASALQRVAEQSLGVNFDVVTSTKATRWYLSVFVCP